MKLADKLMLNLTTNTLTASLYGAERVVVAEDIDALEVFDTDVFELEADAECVVAVFDLAIEIEIENRAGRMVAVLQSPGGGDK